MIDQSLRLASKLVLESPSAHLSLLLVKSASLVRVSDAKIDNFILNIKSQKWTSKELVVIFWHGNLHQNTFQIYTINLIQGFCCIFWNCYMETNLNYVLRNIRRYVTPHLRWVRKSTKNGRFRFLLSWQSTNLAMGMMKNIYI